jgi:hypothetical protein
MPHVDKFSNKILDGYFKLSFVMTEVYSWDAKLGSYFELSFIIEEVGNLDTNLVD